MKITSRSLKRNKYFLEFMRYVNNYWRPNTEAYIRIENLKKNKLINILKHWFDKYPTVAITIGPYENVTPYAYFDVLPDDPNSNKGDPPIIEFLFLYDNIIKSKLKTVHFTLGRDDFIDLS